VLADEVPIAAKVGATPVMPFNETVKDDAVPTIDRRVPDMLQLDGVAMEMVDPVEEAALKPTPLPVF
jgi:hypothetical protein